MSSRLLLRQQSDSPVLKGSKVVCCSRDGDVIDGDILRGVLKDADCTLSDESQRKT